MEQYNKVIALRSEGLGNVRIARILELPTSTVSQWIYSGAKPNGNYKIPNLEASKELCYILGAIYGDGSIPRNTGKVRLEAKDKEFVQEFSRCLSSVLKRVNKYPVWQRDDGRFVTCAHSLILHSFLSGSIEKQKELIEKFPSEFIRGFFDSEGSVSFYEVKGRTYYERRIVVANSELSILEFLQELLMRLSIQSLIREQCKAGVEKVIKGIRTKTTKPLFTLTINRGESLLRYYELIGFTIKRKQERLDQWYKYQVERNKGKTPLDHDVCIGIYREHSRINPICRCFWCQKGRKILNLKITLPKFQIIKEGIKYEIRRTKSGWIIWVDGKQYNFSINTNKELSNGTKRLYQNIKRRFQWLIDLFEQSLIEKPLLEKVA